MTGHVLYDVVWWVGIFFIGYSVLINTSFALLTGLALSDYWTYRRTLDFAAYDESFAEPLAQGITVLMPAYNESATIVDAVRAMCSMRYPDFEVVVVDDGSTDDTVARLIETFSLREAPMAVADVVDTKGAVLHTYVNPTGSVPLVLVSKENGGKADALNVGINSARKTLVCMVDADSILDPDALLHVSRPFADDPDRVVASGGVVRVANGCSVQSGRVTDIKMPHKWLPRIEVVEYLRAFMIGRAGWSTIGGLLIISGAFGVFRRDVLYELNGLATDCIGEDAELVVRLHRMLGDSHRDGEIVFVSEPVAWTETPESRDVLRKQRSRWHRGLTEIFLRHKSMMFRPRYGVIGMVTMPWFFLFELLAPFVELFGLAYFVLVILVYLLERWGVLPGDVVSLTIVAVLLATSVGYAFVVSLVALLAEELSYRRYRGVRDLLIAVWAALEENVGYRQLNSWWRARGAIEALRGSRHEWGDMTRRGFSG